MSHMRFSSLPRVQGQDDLWCIACLEQGAPPLLLTCSGPGLAVELLQVCDILARLGCRALFRRLALAGACEVGSLHLLAGCDLSPLCDVGPGSLLDAVRLEEVGAFSCAGHISLPPDSADCPNETTLRDRDRDPPLPPPRHRWRRQQRWDSSHGFDRDDHSL